MHRDSFSICEIERSSFSNSCFAVVSLEKLSFRSAADKVQILKSILVTGSSRLISSEVCTFFANLGYKVHGIDNNQRAVFFEPQGERRWNQQRLERELRGFEHHELDVRDRQGMLKVVRELRPGIIVPTAAQPSHDRTAAIPFDDFDTNAGSTLKLLEAARQYRPESPFIHMSTDKVYGDAPNRLKLAELETRWDYADPEYAEGIPETFTINDSLQSHSARAVIRLREALGNDRVGSAQRNQAGLRLGNVWLNS